jgi:hypothetical protein
MKIDTQAINSYKVQLNNRKSLEEAARLPQQLTEEMLKLQNKLVNAAVEDKVMSSIVDTYA